MSEYVTEQRKELLSVLKNNPDKKYSAKELFSVFKEKKISISAIYRNLSRLERDGLVVKSVDAGSRECYYRYVLSEHCKNCLHLSCTRCGKTFHMKTETVENVVRNVSENGGFEINKSKTVLYGICGTCGGAKQ
ncbi:MAG: transcriptional repressor [Clostridia bacterium]|nr:transcriptional repressor [Clostridia bacterium]